MESTDEILGQILDRVAPRVAEVFYRQHPGFQDPVGDGRRLITPSLMEACITELRQTIPGVSVTDLVVEILHRVPLLPPPIDADYRPFRDVSPFRPHLVCFALAYVKGHPDFIFIAPFIDLVVRTGWWAGDENCINDILEALPDMAEACRIVAARVPESSSPRELFAAGQLLYHLRYGEDWNLRGYVRQQYELALRTLQDPDCLREVRERLKSGLNPWRVLRS